MKKLRILLVFMLLISALVFSNTGELDRSKTLIYTGGIWSPPSSWNPIVPWNAVAGTNGLVYEPLFEYDPIAGEIRPWLAESGEWVTKNVYRITLRDGVKWADGVEFTSKDVVYTFNLAKDNALYFSNIWDYTEKIEALGKRTVLVTFKENPRYVAWNNSITDVTIVPEHIWSKMTIDQILVAANRDPIGTGPYKVSRVTQDRLVWERLDDWWGNNVFGQPAPQHIVARIVFSNNVILGSIMKGELDFANNFIPGIPTIKDRFGVKTYYDNAPYMISWNTAMLFLNTNRKPLDDVNFRRAIAFAINQQTIVNRVYENMVAPSNPTGLVGTNWMEYYDEKVVEEYGFKFDPSEARRMLNRAGYIDRTGDGWRNAPDGSNIDLTIIVPNGWTDWMESIRSISEDLRAVGIKATPQFPDTSLYEDRMYTGNFDMLINTYGSTISFSPYTYWSWVGNERIDGERATTGNFGRYNDPELFQAIRDFAYLQPEDAKAYELASFIQKRLLQEMPSIPIWHNGLWMQMTEEYWTNWPSEDNPTGLACGWAGVWNKGTIRALIELKPAK